MKELAHSDPRLPEDVQRGVRERRVQLAETCATLLPDGPATIEFGCGHGHYLTAYAEAFPHETCVGLDLVTKRIERASAKVHKRQLDNIYFLKAEVFEFLDVLPENVRFGRIFMLFPDPWPKKRHHKNRMIQHSLLDRVAELALPGAPFCFRTDHAEMFAWAQAHFEENPHWAIDESQPWPFECRSYFQDLMDSWQSLIACRV